MSEAATKRDLTGLESRFDKKLEGLEARFDEKLEGLEARFEGKLDTVEDRLRRHVQETIGEAVERLETRLLTAFSRFVESNNARLTRVEVAESTSADRIRSLEERVRALEQRLDFPARQ